MKSIKFAGDRYVSPSLGETSLFSLMSLCVNSVMDMGSQDVGGDDIEIE